MKNIIKTATQNHLWSEKNMQKNGVNNNEPKKVRIMNIKKLAYSASVLAIMCIGLTNAAYADCTSPASPEGGLAYFTTDDTYRLCDGADAWITLTTGISVSAINDLTDAFTDYATDNNFIMGQASAVALTSGAKYNTFIGDNAGAASGGTTVTTDSNSAVGYNALGSLTVGYNNTALGANALSNMTAKWYNTAIGAQAMLYMYNNDTSNASHNVSLGYQAMRGSVTPANNSGTHNTAIGNNTLLALSSGIGNTALGYHSLWTLNTGSYNVSIGFNTGDTVTTGSDNILIGNDIEPPLSTTSDHLNIGNLIYGDLANGDFIVGSYQLNDTATGTEDNRMFFDKSQSAFRAGSVTGTEWDAGNVGQWSVAMGLGTTASGAGSMSMGGINISSGDGSLTMGTNLTASGDGSSVFGESNTASGTYSTAMGNEVKATGTANTFAIGLSDQTNVDANRPQVSGAGSMGIFMDQVDSYNLTATDTFAVIGGEIMIDGDGNVTAGQGCIRFNDTADELEYSDDCSTYTAINSLGGGSSVFELNSGVVRNTGDHTIEDFVFGSTQLADTTDANHDARMFFDKSKGSFRAGLVDGTQWDNTSIGARSFATGYNTRAVGDNTFAAGSNTYAGAQQSVAMGSWTVANSNNAFAMGSSSTASGNNTFAMGSNVIANGFSSVAMINEVNVTGDFSVGFGMGAPIGVDPIVSGVSSFGIFMDDQNGVDLSQANTMAIMGGNVGIGTVTPASAAVLHLVNTTNDARLHFTNGDGTSGDINYDMGTDGFEFRTGGTSGSDTKMFIGDNGRIGVGTTSPTGTLDVITAGNSTDTILRIGSGVDNSNTSNATLQLRERNGGDYARGFNLLYNGAAGDHFAMQVLNSGGTTEVMRVERADGDMGLGDFSSDSIESKLHIASGDIRLDGGAGNQAGCLRFNDTSDKMEYSHDCSTFSDMGSGGASALNDLSDAVTDYATDHNMFIGNNAGSSIQAGGGDNIFIGEVAGEDNTTGDANIFIGREAGMNNTTGQWNTFVGDDSGRANLGGNYNTAFGGYSLRANTSGANNTALGDGTIEVNTTGSDNVAVGRRALFSSVTGNDNVAIGEESLYTADGASNNTAIGSDTLHLTTSGANNTVLGFQAGNSITTGSSNILIGYDIDAPTATTSNHLNIGDTLYGDLSTDSIGIGQVPAAGVELDVLGDIEYTGTLTDVSDSRLKKDIVSLTTSGSLLDKIDKIDTYSFRMKNDKDARLEFGVMAQELEEIFPELVHTALDEMGTKSVNYVGLIAPMIEATKELNAENKALKSAQIATNAAIANLSKQVSLLNKMADNNVGKASMMPYLMMLFGLLSGIGIMIIIQRKQG